MIWGSWHYIEELTTNFGKIGLNDSPSSFAYPRKRIGVSLQISGFSPETNIPQISLLLDEKRKEKKGGAIFAVKAPMNTGKGSSFSGCLKSLPLGAILRKFENLKIILFFIIYSKRSLLLLFFFFFSPPNYFEEKREKQREREKNENGSPR